MKLMTEQGQIRAGKLSLLYVFGGWSGEGGVLETTRDLVRVGKCSNFKLQLQSCVLVLPMSHQLVLSVVGVYRPPLSRGVTMWGTLMYTQLYSSSQIIGRGSIF